MGRTREPVAEEHKGSIRVHPAPPETRKRATKLVELLENVEVDGKMRQLPLRTLRKLVQCGRPLMLEL